jgi:putative transposase
MDEYESLSHTKWECKYHVVFIPKCRRAARKESRIEEGHLHADHVHMLISIPPKYACRKWSGSLREKARSTSPVCMETRNEIRWPRLLGSRVFRQRDEAVIRGYIKNQEAEDNRLEQLNLWR